MEAVRRSAIAELCVCKVAEMGRSGEGGGASGAMARSASVRAGNGQGKYRLEVDSFEGFV